MSFRHLGLSLTLGLAIVSLSLAGLAVAMPAGPDAPTSSSTHDHPFPSADARTTSRAGAQLVSVGDGPAPIDTVLPAPVPVALKADSVKSWVDARLDAAPAQDDDPWAVIDQCIADDMQGDPNSPADDTTAASIAVAIDGVITYTKGYGVRDVETGGEVDAGTMFRIGSTTKMMTAAAIMQLWDEGAIELDEPLTTYLPELRLGHPWNADDLTLHLLMSHQSGFLDQYFVNDLSTPLMEWVQAIGTYSLPLYAAPGSFWNYANPNFSLAGAVVERVSETPYNEYMSSRVWDPSGMPLTTLDPTEVISTGNYATGYHEGGAVGPADRYIPMLGPAGTAFSTPTELVRWALAMQSEGDDVLSEEARMLMQERYVSLGYLPWMDYGYGIMVTDWQDAQDPNERVVVYDHGGNIYGGSSQLYWIPERGVVVSILANTIRSLDYAASCAVRTLAEIEPIPGDSTITEPETWDVFSGTYSMLDVFQWPWTGRVWRITDTLMLDFPDIYGTGMLMGEDMPFYYAYADVFVPMAQSMLVPQGVDFSFIRDPADPTRVRYMRNRNLVAQRVGQFPDRVSIEGEACATIHMTSELDMPVLQIATSGLVTTTHLVSVPIAADDPEDPSTASLKLDFQVDEGGADMVYAMADSEAEDAVGLFLMFDANGDGAYSLADGELVTGGLNDYGTSLLYMFQALPAGNYQLWVQGIVVQGDASFVDIDLTVMQGDNLRLENRPRGLADGAAWEMRVCADRVAEMQEPRLGMLAFTYDSPPRLFRIMVDWTPSGAPPTPEGIYLPLGKRGD